MVSGSRGIINTTKLELSSLVIECDEYHGMLSDNMDMVNEDNRESLILDLVYGLESLHKRGLIHTDLSPENILVNRDKQCLMISELSKCTYPECVKLEDVNTDYYPLDKKYTEKYDITALGKIILLLWSNSNIPEVYNNIIIRTQDLRLSTRISLEDIRYLLTGKQSSEYVKLVSPRSWGSRVIQVEKFINDTISLYTDSKPIIDDIISHTISIYQSAISTDCIDIAAKGYIMMSMYMSMNLSMIEIDPYLLPSLPDGKTFEDKIKDKKWLSIVTSAI